MFVIRSSVYEKLCIHLSSKRSFWKHAFHCKFNNLLRFLSHHLTKSSFFHSTNIVGVVIINLLLKLLACNFDLISVYNDYIISCVNVRCKLRFVLSS